MRPRDACRRIRPWTTGREKPGTAIAFGTLSGTITARQNGNWITLDFLRAGHLIGTGPRARTGSGGHPRLCGPEPVDILAEPPTAADVCTLEPDMAALESIPARGIIITAASDLPHFDFVSRFFAPSVGVPEDPVTGSAHCCSGPYWGEKLNKTEVDGFQCSARAGP